VNLRSRNILIAALAASFASAGFAVSSASEPPQPSRAVAVGHGYIYPVAYHADQVPHARALVVVSKPKPKAKLVAAKKKVAVKKKTVHHAVTSSRVRASAGRDRTAGLTRAQRSRIPFAVWLSSPTAVKVSWRESKNTCNITNPSGKYQGKWQMDDSFWRSYGGLKYASDPQFASCGEQDQVAYHGWIARGWQPWTTA
jgi:hypothetical protein